MTLKQVQAKMALIQKGRITKVHYLTQKNGYTKETQTLVRFVKYANIKGVQAKGQVNPNETKDQVSEFLIYNANTKKWYLQMATTNTKAKAKVNYYYQGNPITKAEYEMANPPRPSTSPLVVFRKDINDIVDIG